MPISHELLEDGHVLYVDYTDPWSAEDLIAIFPVAQRFYDESPHKLHILVDYGHTRLVPRGILLARKHPAFHHPKSGYIVGISSMHLMISLADTLIRLTNFKRVKMVSSKEEGLAFLREVIAQGE